MARTVDKLDRSPAVPDGLSVTDEGAYVLAEFSGEFSVDAGRRCLDAVVAACSEWERSVVLFDFRKMSGRLTISDRFEVMAYGQTTRGTISRMALVNRPVDILLDSFAENVAVNRGVNLRVFSDIDRAIAWLLP